MEIATELMAINGIFNAGTSLFSIAMYVLLSLGLYTIAQRRGLSNPWLAWIPFGNVWILGSISDQYQFNMKEKKTNRRKILLGMEIACSVVAIILVVVLVAFVFQIAFTAETYEFYEGYGYRESATAAPAIGSVIFAGFGTVVLLLALVALGIVNAIFMYICYYDLYTSCSPDNATVYLVLSILFSFLSSIFVFICRDKDDGMYASTLAAEPVYYYPDQEPAQPSDWQATAAPALEEQEVTQIPEMGSDETV